jgi:IS30 family transposase
MNPLSKQTLSLTYDNGKEFADHAIIDKALGSTILLAILAQAGSRNQSKT